VHELADRTIARFGVQEANAHPHQQRDRQNPKAVDEIFREPPGAPHTRPLRNRSPRKADRTIASANYDFRKK